MCGAAVPRAGVPPLTTPPALLLYDGHCGLCARSVQFVLRHERADRRQALQFAPLDGPAGERVRAQHPQLAGIDSVLWLTVAPDGTEQVRVRSEAVLAVLRHVGGVWAWMAVVGRWVPRPLRDAVYAAVAARRHWLAPRACQLPVGRERQ